MSKKAVVALNGQFTGDQREYLQFIPDDVKYIAADGGAIFLEKLGLSPDVVLGDLDSLSERKIDEYRQQGVKVLKYPVDKDETDGELAIDYCRQENYVSFIIIGSMGGRFDQQLANIFLLEYAYHLDIQAVIREPGVEMGIVGREKIFLNSVGSGLSLLPLNEHVNGITTTGCKYPLNDEELIRYKTRGISNEIIDETARVTVKEGLLLYILIDN